MKGKFGEDTLKIKKVSLIVIMEKVEKKSCLNVPDKRHMIVI